MNYPLEDYRNSRRRKLLAIHLFYAIVKFRKKGPQVSRFRSPKTNPIQQTDRITTYKIYILKLVPESPKLRSTKKVRCLRNYDFMDHKYLSLRAHTSGDHQEKIRRLSYRRGDALKEMFENVSRVAQETVASSAYNLCRCETTKRTIKAAMAR